MPHPRLLRFVLVPIAALLLLLVGAERVSRPGDADVTHQSGSAAPPPTAAEIVAGFSDEELVGQVLMPYVFGDHATEVTADAAAANLAYAQVATPAEMVEKYRLGGVILLPHGGETETNITSPAQVRKFTAGLQAVTPDLPLLIGIDQEYGVVARLTDGVTGLPSALAAGAAGDPALTEAAWRVAGVELAALGVNVNFAPVADVLGPARGGVIGSRSYGSDPEAVAEQVGAVVRGLRASGVVATLKHFPGHGATNVDSHHELPVLDASPETLHTRDLRPFAAGIAAGAEMVMTGHLDVQALDAGVPATFSRAVVTGLLRDELGFTGVVVSDALNMAPAQRWSPAEAAVRALLAGNDVLLMPPDLSGAYEGLLTALRDGTLPREHLVAAVTRIVTVKLALAGGVQPDLATLASEEHQAAVAPLAAAAVTVLRGACTGPLVTGPVTVTAAGGRDVARSRLVEALTAAGIDVVDAGGAVIHLVGYGDDPSDLRREAEVTVAMDMPYLLEESDSQVLIATYSSSRLSLAALADVLAGSAPATGRSPVPLRGLPPSACESEDS